MEIIYHTKNSLQEHMVISVSQLPLVAGQKHNSTILFIINPCFWIAIFIQAIS